MSLHIAAKDNDIAPFVLLPGDPLRAKYIAEKFLSEVKCYNEVRGMLGFTGNYRGKKVSVQGSGMGMPSLSIYVNELFAQYNVSTIIRVGSCGAMQQDLDLRDIVLAMTATTDSSLNHHRFSGLQFAPCADFSLLHTCHQLAAEKSIKVKVGNVFSSDIFYGDDTSWRRLAHYGVLAVEMETAELYTLAAKYKCHALSILTVSDTLHSKTAISAHEREKSLDEMVELALSLRLDKAN